MAKTSSLVDLRGKIGDIVFFKRGGKIFARKAAGSNLNAFRSSSNFVRVRENASEFAALTRLAAAVRKMTASVEPSAVSKLNIQSRLTHLLSPLRFLDTVSVRGKRSFALSRKPELLVGFDWNVSNSLPSLLFAPVTASRSGASVTFAVPALSPSEHIAPPSGATHYRLVFLVSSVSDLTFSDSDNDYAPANAAADMRSALSLGNLTSLSESTETQTVTLANPVAALDSATLVASVAIVFYQQTGGVNYVLKDANALRTIAAWDGGNE